MAAILRDVLQGQYMDNYCLCINDLILSKINNKNGIKMCIFIRM